MDPSLSRKAPGALGRRGPSPWRRAARPLAAAAAALGGAAVLALRSPHLPGAYGTCPSLVVTGLYCAACGGLRAVHELTQGDVAEALQLNAAVVLGVPVVLALWAVWLTTSARGVRFPAGPPWLPVGALGAALLYGALRNVPALVPLLAPGGVAPPILG